ncbi:hypothetical protein V8F06_013290 [Rhypophila decipiens]
MPLYFSAVPGFRPGGLMNTLYRQYTLSIVRDPDDRTQKRIIVTPNIGRNKIKTTQMTCKCRKQKSCVIPCLIDWNPTADEVYPSPLLQCGLLYPSRAFSRPLFGEPCTCPGVGHERVGPRHDLLHRPNLGGTDRLDISGKEEFLDNPLFPCLLVVGCRKLIRPHALRVGAGARMDGVVRPNLASLAFGPKAMSRDEALFSDLRNMSLLHVTRAPPSRCRRNRLPTPGARGAGIAAPVAALLSCPGPQNDGESLAVGASVSERYIDAQLLHLLSIAPSLLRGVPETAAASKSQQNSCCFLCSRGFANRSWLTRHFRDAHLVNSTLYKPLACRRSKRAGAAEVVVHGPGQWCNYEHTDGLIHAPSVNLGINPGGCISTSRLICLLCEAPMASTSTLLAHMNRTEIPRFRNDGRVACRPCTREGRVGGEPMSIWEWLTHAGVVHKWSLSHGPCPFYGHLCATGRGFQKHLTTQHGETLGEAPECAACVASTTPVGEMRGIEELVQHTTEKHPSGQAATMLPEESARGTAIASTPLQPARAKRTKRTATTASTLLQPPRARGPPRTMWRIRRCPPPIELFGADSDPYEDVIICAPTVDDQQRRYLVENHMGPSAILDSDFIRHVDPALLAPQRPAASARYTAAVSSRISSRALVV